VGNHPYTSVEHAIVCTLLFRGLCPALQVMGCVLLVGAAVISRFDENGAMARCKERAVHRSAGTSGLWETAVLLSTAGGSTPSLQSRSELSTSRASNTDLSAVLTQVRPAHRSLGSGR
jgi:hypothetical protein